MLKDIINYDSCQAVYNRGIGLTELSRKKGGAGKSVLNRLILFLGLALYL